MNKNRELSAIIDGWESAMADPGVDHWQLLGIEGKILEAQGLEGKEYEKLAEEIRTQLYNVANIVL